jgi:hypothetical protein
VAVAVITTASASTTTRESGWSVKIMEVVVGGVGSVGFVVEPAVGSTKFRV